MTEQGGVVVGTFGLPAGLAGGLARCLAPADEASCLPAACYSDLAVHLVERD